MVVGRFEDVYALNVLFEFVEREPLEVYLKKGKICENCLEISWIIVEGGEVGQARSLDACTQDLVLDQSSK